VKNFIVKFLKFLEDEEDISDEVYSIDEEEYSMMDGNGR
jgi:hypothetical protein